MDRKTYSSTDHSNDDIDRQNAANRIKAEFIANVSHELRTPIHAIIGYVELLEDGIYGALTDEQSQTIEYIHETARDLLSIVNNLLDLSRIESGRSDLALTTFNLRDLVSEIFSQIKPLSDAKHLTLESKFFVENATVRSDRGKLKQVLVNLLGNAIKFTDCGKATVTVAPCPNTVSVGLSSYREHVLITVEDTGVGIPRDKLDMVFEKFYQVDGSSARPAEGTGLGLYIAKQLLDLLAGTVAIQSTVGKGTAITISLPRNFEEIEGIRRLRKHLDSALTTTRSDRATNKQVILAVSNNPNVSRILSDGLGRADYEVLVTRPTNEVMALVKKHRPLVILLNAEESSSEYWSIFQELKCAPETRAIPTIFLGSDDAHKLGVPLNVATPIYHHDVLKSIRSVGQTSKKNILVVDDDHSFREVIRYVLSEEGYQIAEATNGKEAIAQLENKKPDLLLLDLHLPELDGWGVIRYITQTPELRNMEVLIVTGDILGEPELCSINSHTSGVIYKRDLRVNDVLTRVAGLLEIK